jgi:hypothetical protein
MGGGGEGAELLRAHPELRRQMEASSRFARLAARKRIALDGRVHYIVRGDTLGDLDELYVDALVRGAAPGSADADARALFDELPAELKPIIERKLHRR